MVHVVNNKIVMGGETILDALTIEKTDDSAAAGPNFILTRNSASPTKSDVLGKIHFQGQNDAGNTIRYASIDAVIRKTDAGDDESKIQLTVRKDGNHKPIVSVSNEGCLLHVDAPVVFQNSGYKKTLVSASATAKRQISFPDQSGSVMLNESGKVMAADLPTSDPSNAGQLWNDSGTVKISAG
jgi:hypothetical protein